jgi:hypothetical protein
MLPKTTFYIATSYLQKDKANSLAKLIMNQNNALWPSFPWWMYSEDEDKHERHQGAVGDLEIIAAGESDVFIWIHPTRKGGYCELGAACYRRAKGADNTVVMIIPESAEDEYLPPMCYQHGVHRVLVPDKTFKSNTQLARFITNYLKEVKCIS